MTNFHYFGRAFLLFALAPFQNSAADCGERDDGVIPPDAFLLTGQLAVLLETNA